MVFAVTASATRKRDESLRRPEEPGGGPSQVLVVEQPERSPNPTPPGPRCALPCPVLCRACMLPAAVCASEAVAYQWQRQLLAGGRKCAFGVRPLLIPPPLLHVGNPSTKQGPCKVALRGALCWPAAASPAAAILPAGVVVPGFRV